MKKCVANIFATLAIVLLVMPLSQCRRGAGGAIIGGFAGGMMGSVVGNAISKDSGNSRAIEEAHQARQEAREVRKDQDRDRLDRIEQQRRDEEMRRLQDRLKDTERSNSPVTFLLISLVVIFGLALAVLGFLLVRRKQ